MMVAGRHPNAARAGAGATISHAAARGIAAARRLGVVGNQYRQRQRG
jgi:hypothetical protein